MPTSSLVLTTTPAGLDPAALACAVPGLALGDACDAFVPAVLEALTYAEHDAALRALRDHPAITQVDVVFHDFSDVDRFDERLPRKSPRSD